MRTSSLIIFALLSGVAGATGAQDQSAAVQVPDISVTGQRIPQHYYVAPEIVHDVSGAYLMSNNEPARITDRRSKLYVEFDQRVTELRPIGENLYASNDSQMVLRWKPEGFGDGIALSYVPRQALAMGDHTLRTVRAVAAR